jgi:hypothetical protein
VPQQRTEQPANGRQPHIIVDFFDPDGPTIRRIAPPLGAQ